MEKKRIYLIGYRGSGKTTIGEILARELAYQHFDFDKAIEEDKGMTIFKAITLYGEHDYRNGEAEFTDKSLNFEDTLISTSADVVLDPLNTATIKGETIVFLDGDPHTFFDRIKDRKDIPISYFHMGDEEAQRKKFVENYSKRWELYSEAASFTVNTEGLSPEEVSAIILRRIQD